MRKMRLSFVLITMIMLGACQPEPPTLDVSEPWARQALAGNNSAAYMLIANGTGEDEALLAAECDRAETVELHLSKMNEDGTMMMMEQETIPVPAGETVELKPGGLHIMLIGLKSDLIPGEMIDISLTFERAGTITMKVPVREP